MADTRFRRLAPITRPASPTPMVRVGMMRKYTVARLEILLAQPLIDDLGATYSIDLGDDAAVVQTLRLTADPDGAFAVHNLHRPGGSPSQTWRLVLPPVERFPLVSIPPREVAFRRKSRTIEITLPSWAWDRTMRREAEQIAARLASRRALRESPPTAPPPLAPLPERTRATAGSAGAMAANIGRRLRETT